MWLYRPPYSVHVPRLLNGITLPPITLTPQDRPVYSRDSETATRSMQARLGGSGTGGGGGGYRGDGGDGGYGGGGGGGRPSGLPGRPPTNSGPAHRMITGALGTGRR